MTKFLASVTGPEEAEIALAAGADFIDLKDPAEGALGAVTPEVLARTIACVAGGRPVSAVAGDLPVDALAVRAAVAALAAADYVKVGLFPGLADERRAVIAALADLAERTRLIAVFFADGDFDPSLLAELRQAGFHGAMIDTMNKAGGGLLRHLSVAELGRFVEAARRLDLVTGLAGSLEPPDVPRLLVLQPDYLGFRGALTEGGRNAAISFERVKAIRDLIDAASNREDPHSALGVDRIFVRDYTLEMEIGAYGFERGRRQKVRFSVDAQVLRQSAQPSGMADIYSYDIIMDAIRTLVARGHTDLVETLAEELAATLLTDGRIESVVVRVEKLELGPAAVGIEIHRGK